MSDFKPIGNLLDDEFIAKFCLIADDPCPVCGHQMLAFQNPNNGKPRSKPACPDCGFRVGKDENSVPNRRVKEQQTAQQQQALAYLRNSSQPQNAPALKKTFDQFKTANRRDSELKQMALQAVNSIIKGSPTHVIFSGATGTGKTHLAMAIVNRVLQDKQYVKTVNKRQGEDIVEQNEIYRAMFINYRELLEQMRNGIHDEEQYRLINRNTVAEIKEADLVVIDDFGSESGDGDKPMPASRYNIETATSLFEARENKATIITTNWSGENLQKIYGSRVVSRIVANSREFVAKFDGLKDHRIMQGA